MASTWTGIPCGLGAPSETVILAEDLTVTVTTDVSVAATVAPDVTIAASLTRCEAE